MIWRYSTDMEIVEALSDAEYLGGFLYNNNPTSLYDGHYNTPLFIGINTPYLWKNVRRRGFRLFAITAIVCMGGILSVEFFQKSQMGFREVTYEEFWEEYGCVPAFLLYIIPFVMESKLIFSIWVLCACALFMTIILQWDMNWAAFMDFFRQTRFHLKPSTDPLSKTEAQPTAEQTEAQPALPKSIKSYITSIVVILFKIIYGIVYITIQALPLYHLWRIRWLRRHVRSIIQPPTPETTLYAPFANYTEVLAAEAKNWDNDDWSFGQILTLSLWFPALLEMLYILIDINP
jgi:hypothetical protein